MEGFRSEDSSRPCAGLPRESEVTAIEKGADASATSSAHDDQALLLSLLDATGAAAVKLFMLSGKKGGLQRARRKGGERSRSLPSQKKQFVSRIFEEKSFDAGSHFFPLLSAISSTLPRPLFRAFDLPLSRFREPRLEDRVIPRAKALTSERARARRLEKQNKEADLLSTVVGSLASNQARSRSLFSVFSKPLAGKDILTLPTKR